MRAIFQQKALRYVFVANVVSMLGSGMNSTAAAWFILQKTHSEMALGTFAMLQTIPAMLLLPFTGVIIDREDRRWLVMALDATRAVVVLTVAILALMGKAQLWQVYLMNTLVAAGFWMFWPTITALIQELTPGEEFVHANTFLMAGIQGGWSIAGAIVGFAYNHIGLGGVLLIDVGTYLISFLCYLGVRKGRQTVVAAPQPAAPEEGAYHRFIREMREGLHFLRDRPAVIRMGVSWALFLGAMLTGVIVTAPLSDNVFHAGAVGYGWLNGGWGTGALLSALYAPAFIAKFGTRRTMAISLGALAVFMTLAPLAPWLMLAVVMYAVMGSGRGLSGVAMNTGIMEQVPKHFMGRVQNTFYFFGTATQVLLGLIVGAVAHLNLAAGFAVIGMVYALGFLSASWPVKTNTVTPQESFAE